MKDRRDPEFLRRFRTADWERLVWALTEYAICRTRRLYWKCPDYQLLARGETAESLVSWAVEKVLAGERRWDREKCPDLEVFLKGVIDSLIHMLVISLENRKGERLPDQPQALDALLRRRVDTVTGAEGRDPEAALIEQEQRQHEAALLEKFTERIRDEPDLMQLWECLRQGLTKPHEIAQQIGWPVEEVYQLIRKLKRRLAAVEEETFRRPRSKTQEVHREE